MSIMALNLTSFLPWELLICCATVSKYITYYCGFYFQSSNLPQWTYSWKWGLSIWSIWSLPFWATEAHRLLQFGVSMLITSLTEANSNLTRRSCQYTCKQMENFHTPAHSHAAHHKSHNRKIEAVSLLSPFSRLWKNVSSTCFGT